MKHSDIGANIKFVFLQLKIKSKAYVFTLISKASLAVNIQRNYSADFLQAEYSNLKTIQYNFYTNHY